MKSWTILFLAAFFEVVWAIGLKYSTGFTKLVPSIVTIMGIIISMGLLAIATKNISIGSAYSIWTGVGAVGTCIGGIILFNEPAGALRLFFIGLIVIGIIGLKVLSPD